MNHRTTALRDLVQARLDEHWLTWSNQHPHLADAIDRTRLIDLTVERLQEDPAFREAMRRIDLDAHQLEKATSLLALADQWVRDVLPG